MKRMAQRRGGSFKTPTFVWTDMAGAAKRVIRIAVTKKAAEIAADFMTTFYLGTKKTLAKSFKSLPTQSPRSMFKML
jgi:hypothetical protein